MKKTKIVFLSRYDYANVLSNWSMGINKYSNKITSKSISFEPHIFKYKIPHDYDLSKIDNEKILRNISSIVKDADYIIFAEENFPSSSRPNVLSKVFQKLKIRELKKVKAYRNNNISVFHGGSVYRNNYEALNLRKNRYNLSFYSPDLYRLSPQNSNDLVIFPTLHLDEGDIPSEEEIRATLSERKKIILHTPSNKITKNSKVIRKNLKDIESSLKKIGVEYLEISGVSNEEVLAAKKNSLFFIDQYNSWGGPGVSAIEAMANGSIVFCSMQNTPQTIFSKFSNSKKEIPIAYLYFKDDKDFKEKILRYTSLSDEKLLEVLLRIRSYYLKNLSPYAAAMYFERYFKK